MPRCPKPGPLPRPSGRETMEVTMINLAMIFAYLILLLAHVVEALSKHGG